MRASRQTTKQRANWQSLGYQVRDKGRSSIAQLAVPDKGRSSIRDLKAGPRPGWWGRFGCARKPSPELAASLDQSLWAGEF